jgi:predicted metal-binding protein
MYVVAHVDRLAGTIHERNTRNEITVDRCCCCWCCVRMTIVAIESK